VPELNVLVRNQTDRVVPYRLWLGRCRGVDGPWLGGGEIPANGWSHRSAPLVDFRGKLPCEVPLTVFLGRETPLAKAKQSLLSLAARTQAPPPGAVRPEEVVLSAVAEKGCAPGRSIVRVLVESHSPNPIRVRARAPGNRCSGATAVAWESVDRASLDLAPRGWGVLVDSVRAANSALLRACTGWVEVEGGEEGSPTLLGRVEFPLFSETATECPGRSSAR